MSYLNRYLSIIQHYNLLVDNAKTLQKLTLTVHFYLSTHRHPKNWFFALSGTRTQVSLITSRACWATTLSRLPRWQRSRLTRWLSSVGIPMAQLFFIWECILASITQDRAWNTWKLEISRQMKGIDYVMYQSNRSFNISPPGNPRAFVFFAKFLFKFPPPEAEKLFKCPIIDPFQVIKCPHPRETFR